MSTTHIGWGERLRGRRTAAGITQEAFGAGLGVNRMTVYRWEAGQRLPDVPTQVRIAEALGTTVTELFPRTEDEADLATRCTRRQHTPDEV